MGNEKPQAHRITAGSELDRAVAQRDALFALAEATAELLSRSSVSAGDMLLGEARRCLDAPEAELVLLTRRDAVRPVTRSAA
jgi:hypothetical protein